MLELLNLALEMNVFNKSPVLNSDVGASLKAMKERRGQGVSVHRGGNPDRSGDDMNVG
jgi:hypothetical protein